MATTVYGSTVNHWRAYMTYTAGTTDSDTIYTVTVSAAGIQSVSWGFAIDHVDCTLSATGLTSKSVTDQSFTAASGSTTAKSLTNATFSWSKGHSAATKTITVTTKNHSGYMDGTSSKSITVTVPVKTHYTVSYNANGGSGAPSSQTKWYGEQLTLSTTKPTRTGYTFLGWATSSSATSATYAAGATYTTNSALSLYAVWKKNYVAPTISSGTAYRCDSSGTAEDEGTYIKGQVKWSVDTAQTSGNKGKNLVIAYYNTSTSAYVNLQTITLSTASGTTSYGPIRPSGGFSTDQSYKIRFTVTDTTTNSGNSATKVVTLSQAFFLMDALAQTSGKAIAFGRAATTADNGKMIVGGPLKLNLESSMTVSHGNASTNAFYTATRTDTGNTIQFGIGTGGVNRGIWDVPTGKWIVLVDSNGNANYNGITGDSWHTTTYTSPFSNYNDLAANAPHYRKYGDVVSFYGIATVAAEQENAVRTLFTLPEGYRPTGATRYIGRMQGSGANSWELSVTTGGAVQLQRYGTTSSIAVPANAWLTYSGTFII